MEIKTTDNINQEILIFALLIAMRKNKEESVLITKEDFGKFIEDGKTIAFEVTPEGIKVFAHQLTQEEINLATQPITNLQ